MRKLKITELNRISAEEFKQAEKLPLVARRVRDGNGCVP